MDSYPAILAAIRRPRRLFGAALAALAIGAGSIGFAGLAPIGSALAQERAGSTVRPEVGKPLEAAIKLLKRKRGKEALARIRKAEAVPNKTPYEMYLVERVRGQAAAAAGNASEAARAFEATAASSAVSGAERLQFLAAAAGQYYLTRNYAKTVALSARYFKDGGTDKSIRTLYIQALYLDGDFAAAGKHLQSLIQSEEQAGKAPAEAQLQLLANVYVRQRNNAAYAKVLEKLAAHYPKKAYWLALVDIVSTRSGFSGRLALDLARLKLATGTMRTAAEYVEAAELSILAGLPAEAKKIIDQGYAAGLLGSGPDADRHRRLKDMVARNLVQHNKTLGQRAAAAKDGAALLTFGLSYVLHGNSAKGLRMMEQGLRRGGLKHPNEARLHLAYAYHLAGQNEKAVQIFKAVHGSDGAAAMARLWIILLGH
jgi:hypothetical protein